MQVMSTKQVADLAGVGVSTVTRWRNLSVSPLRATMSATGCMEFARDDVEQFLSEPRTRQHFTHRALALDLEDLAHMTNRGDVGHKMWARVCGYEPGTLSALRQWDRWKRRVRDRGFPVRSVDDVGDPIVRGGREAFLRFDWPPVLRWCKWVLD